MKRAALVLGLSVLVAGCSGEADDTPPAALPPVTASPVAPGLQTRQPVDALPATSDGASQFARHWLDALNSAYLTLNTDALSSLSAPECATCQAYIASITAARLAGQRWEGGTVQVRAATASALVDQRATVVVDCDIDAFAVVEPTGERTRQQAPESGAALQVALVRQGEGWLVAEVVQP